MSSLRNYYTQMTKPRGVYATRELTSDGTQAGSRDMNVDGSLTSVQFWYQPQPTDLFRVDAVHLSITDNGEPGYDEYGSIPGPLPNGTRIFVERDGVLQYWNRIYRTNEDWITVATASDIYEMAITSRIVVYRAEFSRFATGELFSGRTNDRFGIEINDDLTTLQVHNCSLIGADFRAAA